MAVAAKKKRNFKGLHLPQNASDKLQLPSSVSVADEPNHTAVRSSSSRSPIATIGSQTIILPGNSHSARYHNKLQDQLATLELGLEFKVEFRNEDLQMLEELGSGNGGTIIHVDAKEQVQKQILRELQIMHDCSSPYIVSFYGAFPQNTDICMCMEYMPIGSLDHIYRRSGPIPVPILGKVAFAVTAGLSYLYDVHRIIHRDVKPSNILVGGEGQIKLCDFGVSGELINSIANTFVGTSTYMSPERIQGAQYSIQSDIWSFGISLIEMALGRFPFAQSSGSTSMSILDLLQRIVNEPPPRLPMDGKFPASLDDLTQQCLLDDPARRPVPQKLLQHPFLVSSAEANIDMEEWVKSLAPSTPALR